MEMHTSETLHARYAIAVQPRPRTPWLWVESLLAICCWIRQAIRREWELRHAVAELENLSDHLLKDIGISRCDIRHVVRGTSPLRHRPGDGSC
jgi:uncharacterized protein YjiS (DUF1127 family)